MILYFIFNHLNEIIQMISYPVHFKNFIFLGQRENSILQSGVSIISMASLDTTQPF